MKKRVVSLLLCLVMVLSVFLTGCNTKTTDESFKKNISKASLGNVTLSLWVVSESPVSKETADAVEAALNAISEPELQTRLDVQYFTMEEYEQKLAAAITNYKPGVLADPNAVQSEYELQYPALLANQVDIIYIEGKAMYSDYVAKGWLQSIDNILTKPGNETVFDDMTSHLPTQLLNAIKLDGKKFYAIPNNNVIGDYTYMLLNKDLLEEWMGGYNDRMTGFYNEDVYLYLEKVMQYETDDVNLIDASYEDCLNLLAYYWNFDSNMDLKKEFSVFGHAYANGDVIDRNKLELTYSNLFANKQFADDFLKLCEFEAEGYFSSDATKDSALKIVKCDLENLANYTDEYYPVILQYPSITEETLYDNGMFGVCKNAENTKECMKLISYINTNVAFRNTLLYGVEGVHYEKQVFEEANVKYYVVSKINDDYSMSMSKTGNVFVSYALDTDNRPVNAWANAKVQNREALIDPTLGLNVKENSALNMELANYLNSLNEDLVALINETKTGSDWYDDMVALVDEIAELLNSASTRTVDEFVVLKDYINDTNKTVAGDLDTLRTNLGLATGGTSPYGAYKSWKTAYTANLGKK